jgi:UbiD family decarboxylase
MRKHLKSLREYLEALDTLGDLRTVDGEADPDLEIGAVVRRSTENMLPAPLFTAVRGHPGVRVLGAPAALSSLPRARWARAALSLGFDHTTHPLEMAAALAAALDRPPVPPVTIDDTPCQQVVLRGDDASLDLFPAPLIHAGDGGRYAGTWAALVVRTPDGSWTNWSITRVMAAGPRTLVPFIAPAQDIGKIHAMWRDRGEPMPAALVQGCEPCVPFVCSMGLKSGVDEAGFIGAYFSEPVQVARCVSVDLEVPATAEIVCEGHISVTDTLPEGPMGEFLGYITGEPKARPVFTVSAITHREKPIMPVVSAGKPVEEVHTTLGLTYSAIALRNLRAAGLPVLSAWLMPEAASNVLAVTVARDWKARSTGTCTTTRMLTRAVATAGLLPKVGYWATRVMVLDDDIDPTDPRDVMWAFATRCHPVDGQVLLEDQFFTPLHIFYSAAERSVLCGPKMAYDCLLPPDPDDRPVNTAFAENFPADVRLRALELLAARLT